MQKQQDSENESQEREQKDRIRDFLSRPEITGIAIAFWVFVFAFFLLRLYIYDHVPNDPERTKVLVESMFSLALAIVVIIQAGIYFRQAKALDAQQKIMDASLKFGMRAYVGVHSIKFKSREKRIFIEIENVGKRPAHHITVSGNLEIHVPVPSHPTDEERHISQIKELTRPRTDKDYLPPDPERPIKGGALINLVGISKNYRRAKLYAGNLRILIMVRLDESITEENFDLITEGVAIMRVKGTIRYNDGFNSGQESFFAFRYFLKDDLWILDPIIAGKQIPSGGGEQPHY